MATVNGDASAAAEYMPLTPRRAGSSRRRSISKLVAARVAATTPETTKAC